MYRRLFRSAGVEIERPPQFEEELTPCAGIPQMPITIIHPSAGMCGSWSPHPF